MNITQLVLKLFIKYQERNIKNATLSTIERGYEIFSTPCAKLRLAESRMTLVSDALFAKLTKSCGALRQIDKNQTLTDERTNEHSLFTKRYETRDKIRAQSDAAQLVSTPSGGNSSAARETR